MRPIKVAWINDWWGSLGRSPEEEIADELDEFQEYLGYQVDVVAQGRGVDILEGVTVELVVFDYGGAARSYSDTPWWQLREICKWAKEHEGKLVILYSTITRKMYETLLKEEAADEIRSENVKFWTDRGYDFRNDVALRAEIRTWFVGGDFEPYEDPAPPHAGLEFPKRS